MTVIQSYIGEVEFAEIPCMYMTFQFIVAVTFIIYDLILHPYFLKLSFNRKIFHSI